jgi:CheY-like chemotaxis protein
MEPESATVYCPRCQDSQRTFQFQEGDVSVRRCQACGFPVESGLALEGGASPRLFGAREVRILCVDDDPLILQMLGDILRFHGYTVLTALDGEAGLDSALCERPDLIFLDVMMPGIDGFEVCRLLKAHPDLKSIPVIILTAMNDTKLSARAFQVGALLALQKTAETTAVLRTIEAALTLGGTSPSGAVEGPEPAWQERESDLSVPMRRVAVTFWTMDGDPFEAALSLHLNAESHGGPESVLDRLNDPSLFLTVSVPDESSVLFLSKSQVIRVDVPLEELSPSESTLPQSTGTEAVLVRLVNGERLAGKVTVEGPAGRSRLSDCLNTPQPFLAVIGSERLHLLHKRFISRIIPQGS